MKRNALMAVALVAGCLLAAQDAKALTIIPLPSGSQSQYYDEATLFRDYAETDLQAVNWDIYSLAQRIGNLTGVINEYATVGLDGVPGTGDEMSPGDYTAIANYIQWAESDLAEALIDEADAEAAWEEGELDYHSGAHNLWNPKYFDALLHYHYCQNRCVYAWNFCQDGNEDLDDALDLILDWVASVPEEDPWS